jgi:hypothetical protein
VIRNLGKRIRFGHCLCNDAAIAVIGDFFIDSVDKIGEIMEKFVCPAFLALDIVINAGVSAIPGVGQAITAGMSECTETISVSSMANVKKRSAYKLPRRSRSHTKVWTRHLRLPIL